MDMGDDAEVPEVFHGEGKDVPAQGLGQVFHELRAVSLLTGPALLRVQAQEGDALPTVLGSAPAGVRVGQAAAGGEAGKEDSPILFKTEAADAPRCGIPDDGPGRGIHIPPETDDVRIRSAPAVNQQTAR